MQPTDIDQIVSLVGALLVLGAYVANLVHRLDRDSAAYASLNMVGAAALAYVAFRSAAAGLILIEVAWTLVSALALARSLRARGA